MKKPRGRPRLDPSGVSVPVFLRLGPRTYDAVYLRAREDRSTVNEWIRKALDEDLDPNIRNQK